ncbi:MAG: class I SAM-dependent methyltransferase [Paenibacillus sp.]|nr:class I SAM-dependent methyltransferase [Paenibacillus sp.]
MEKAKTRTRLTEVFLRIVQDVAVSGAMFDVVFVESVTVFTKVSSPLGVYYRVLKPGGILYDHEMALTRKSPSAV